ncbi:MAG: hypothetical protein JSV88_05335 [Candidatus Aminicenantes bacterium]|nr:MAG: hypothetical protein JSV88_05335 [Candidatus Aminicenantes bacterium]
MEKQIVLISCPVGKLARRCFEDGFAQLKRIELVFCDRSALGFESYLSQASIVVDWQLSAEEIVDAENLKFFYCWGVGTDKIDLASLRARGVLVRKLNVFCARSIAEYVLMQVLVWERELLKWNEKGKTGHWLWHERNDFLFRELSDLNIVILGLGSIGKEIAKLFSKLGTRPYVATRNKNAHWDDLEFCDVISFSDIYEVLPTCDYLSVNIPLDESTVHIIDKKILSMLNNRSVIINTSRGRIIYEKDLVYYLRNNLIRGASLDVTLKEPLPENNAFSGLDNVIITCHHSGYSRLAVVNFCNALIDDVRRIY